MHNVHYVINVLFHDVNKKLEKNISKKIHSYIQNFKLAVSCRL